ncbi:MAG: carboxylating nicotinate-nucleotide diphosphorylase [endosymbiont of Galathealinum brachiosum]|uniref:Probable nicotinate-nucleotide pyrophosphorylase [carboxylating] n=1 Tax=endosymbiont of Galathealinum brachiosum TaxID=2200906 RepID=A0A370DB13_9GAMM|nr:MAG: carboxylating nicotinate-nucleotide diphosphorylase [endosymbiont of Galathealinum brachiosum]
MHVPHSYIEESVHIALTEDIGNGDVTAKLIPEDDFSLATVISREDATICGIDWFEEVFAQLDSQIFIEWDVDDGDTVKAGQQICSLSGSTRALLTGERSALNFLQTLSSTATKAAEYAAAIKDTNVKVLDTRKTIPGLRLAQKYAVSCGGGHNHRVGLFDAILIKENHILAAGGIPEAVEAARFHNPDLMIEVEVENLDELQLALNENVDRIMLDNFDLDSLTQAVKINNHKTELEASGNVTLKTISAIARTGVDYISTGALTKDIKALDLSMRFS